MESNQELVDYLVSTGMIVTPEVINAFRYIDRKKFVPENIRTRAYDDEPLPIGKGQTISQPSTVALMTEALAIEKGSNVLEIGTGSGYQAALISKIVGENGKLFTIERREDLFLTAKKNLENFANIEVILGDGSLGFEKESPFDRIIVTAASPSIPQPLKNQLRIGGKMIIPVGEDFQRMILVLRTERGYEQKDLGEFIFVPMIGKHGFRQGLQND
jgi:protein-L-isoaspartate(D-aspartate) O-methyltransferase